MSCETLVGTRVQLSIDDHNRGPGCRSLTRSLTLALICKEQPALLLVEMFLLLLFWRKWGGEMPWSYLQVFISCRNSWTQDFLKTLNNLLIFKIFLKKIT